MRENSPPMSGLNVVDNASATPASAIAPIGALTPAAPAIGIATKPSAADIEGCGLYHMDRTRLSTRSPRNRQLLIASMFRTVRPSSGRPREYSSHQAYRPSALAATTASTIANAVPTAESDAAHVARISAAMNNTPEQSAFTFSDDSMSFNPPGPSSEITAGTRKYVQ